MITQQEKLVNINRPIKFHGTICHPLRHVENLTQKCRQLTVSFPSSPSFSVPSEASLTPWHPNRHPHFQAVLRRYQPLLSPLLKKIAFENAPNPHNDIGDLGVEKFLRDLEGFLPKSSEWDFRRKMDYLKKETCIQSLLKTLFKSKNKQVVIRRIK